MAALGKITDLRSYHRQVTWELQLPYFLEWPALWILPWLELTCGLCLALGYSQREAAVILSVLLFIFLGYGLAHWGEPCGCFLFPVLQERSFDGWPMLRNIILLGCSLRVAWGR